MSAMTIGLSIHDNVIGQEIGSMLWQLLPEIYPDLSYDAEDQPFTELWSANSFFRLEKSPELSSVVQYR